MQNQTLLRIIIGSSVFALLLGLPAMGATRTFDFDTEAYGTPDSCGGGQPAPPLFHRPGHGQQTVGFIVGPIGCGLGTIIPATDGNDSQLTGAAAFSLPNSDVLRFSWVNPSNDESWVRVITQAGGGIAPKFPSPTVYLGVGGKISMNVSMFAVDAGGIENMSGQVELSLLIRETGRNLPLGENGGTEGGLELIGAASMGVGGTSTTPVGGAIINESSFQAFNNVEWEVISPTLVRVRVDGVQQGADRPVLNWNNGDGSFSGVAFSRGALDSLAIRKGPDDDVSKKLFVWVDDVVIDSGAVTDPVKVEAPIQEFSASATVSYIDPAATEVRLLKNGVDFVPAQFTNPAGATEHTFTFATPPWITGDVITATQTVGGNTSDPSFPVTVSRTGMLDDFSNGVSGAANGTDPRVYYQARGDTFGSVVGDVLDNSPALRVNDGGFGNGLYVVFPVAIPAAGSYHIEADVLVQEDPAQTNSIRAYEMGVKVNGAYRTGDYLDPIVGGEAGQAVASYTGLTNGLDNLGIQHLSTGTFTAAAGDSLLIAFSTNVDARHGANIGDPVRNWGFSDGSSATWGANAHVYIDNIQLVGGPSCSDISVVTIKTGPLVAGAGAVTVTDVNPAAQAVKVYADGQQIGATANPGGIGLDTVVVPLNEPLAAHQVISATQTLNNTEGCVLTSGPQVGSGQNGALRMSLGIRETNDTGPIGAIGGTAGQLECLGAAEKLSGSPQGKPVTVSPNWQTLTFTPGVDPTTPGGLVGTGDQALATSGFGVLESLVISAEPLANETGPYTLYIDNIKNGDTVIEGFETGRLLFKQPTYSGSTSANLIIPPNTFGISTTQGENSAQSGVVNWQFIDEGDGRWIRLTTFGQNPEVDLSQPITISFLLLPAGPAETAPVLSAAVSRKTHGSAGTFDINVKAGATEDRNGGPTTIVATFDKSIQLTNGNASVSLSSGTVGSLAVSGNQLTITMSGAAPNSPLTIGFPGVANANDASLLAADTLCIGVILGDADGDRLCRIFDVVVVRNVNNTTTTAGTFRMDVTADGAINLFDVVFVRNNMNAGPVLCP